MFLSLEGYLLLMLSGIYGIWTSQALRDWETSEVGGESDANGLSRQGHKKWRWRLKGPEVKETKNDE